MMMSRPDISLIEGTKYNVYICDEYGDQYYNTLRFHSRYPSGKEETHG